MTVLSWERLRWEPAPCSTLRGNPRLAPRFPESPPKGPVWSGHSPFKVRLYPSLFPLTLERWCPQATSAEQKLKFILIRQDSIEVSSFFHVKNSFLFKVTVCGQCLKEKWTSLPGHSQQILGYVYMLPFVTTSPNDFKTENRFQLSHLESSGVCRAHS